MEIISNPLYVVFALCLAVLAAEWLVRRTALKHFGTALLVILITAILANAGAIPSASNASPVYDIVFTIIAPLAIFYLLLEVNLKNLRRAGLPMLLLFLLGSLATMIGVAVGMWAVTGRESLGPLYGAIGGMFAGTYIGGSINFNAIALHYEVTKQGNLYAGAIAVDNILTTFWMIATIAIPKLLNRKTESREVDRTADAVPPDDDAVTVTPYDLTLMLVFGLGALLASNWLTGLISRAGFNVPSILILTSLALVLAQFPVVNRLKGGRLLGLFSVYVFMAVIGAYCEFAALAGIGPLGLKLLIFVTVLVLTHGIVIFGIGALIYRDWDMIAIASQANIGGGASALALARSLDRKDLYLPAILVGSLGNGIGTYLGFLIIRFL